MENSVKDLYEFLLSGINETNNSLATEQHLLNFWENRKHPDSQYLSNHKMDTYISNANNKISILKFRLEWLETQLTSIR